MTTTIQETTSLPLTRIVGKPTTIAVNRLKKEMYDRAANIPTADHAPFGHLGAVMPDPDYQALTGHAFPVPEHPGALDQLQGGVVAVAEATREWTAQVLAAVTYQKAMKRLADLIRAAIEVQYIASLEDPVLGFGNVSALALLAHIVRKYATMTPKEAEDMRTTLTAAINLDDPLESLWMKITNVQHAVARIAPITDATAITLTLNAFKETGVYDIDVTDWKKKPEADKTMANFRDHFDEADKERRLNLTAGAAGLHGANGAINQAPAAGTAARHNVNAGRPMAYCYSHGATVNLSHTSATCTNRVEGHQAEATMDNMMGGCSRIRIPPPLRAGDTRRNPRTQPSTQA